MFWQHLSWPEAKPAVKKFWINPNYKKGVATHQRWFLLFKGILGFSVPSIILADLLGNRCFLEQVQKVMVCYWWISICFACFCVSLGSLLSLGQSSTSLIGRFFPSFLFLSLARIKQCLPPSLDKNSTNHDNFLHHFWPVQIHDQFCFVG